MAGFELFDTLGSGVESCLFTIGTLVFLLPAADVGAKYDKSMKDRAQIARISRELSVDALDDAQWQKADEIRIDRYWSGDPAPTGRHFRTRLLWSDAALYVRFETDRDEPLTVSDKPDLKIKTNGLWDRDVCEIFIAPNRNDRNRYFEFEIAPTGEWIDIAINGTSAGRKTDWDYVSGMESAARIDKNRVMMAIKVPWKALGREPEAGSIWLGNVFRCVGKKPDRGYLAWQATKTRTPDFHVPARFGEFEFTK